MKKKALVCEIPKEPETESEIGTRLLREVLCEHQRRMYVLTFLESLKEDDAEVLDECDAPPKPNFLAPFVYSARGKVRTGLYYRNRL